MLAPLSTVDDAGGLPTVELKTSLYDALAAMLVSNADYVRVVRPDGEPAGLLSRHRVLSIDYPADKSE